MRDDELNAARLLRRYGAAVDGRRWDVFDQIFEDEVEADYGAGELFKGLAAFKDGARRAWGSFDASQHLLSIAIWEREGDHGRSLAYGDWFIVRKAAVGGDSWQGKGWYFDTWRRGSAGWRIRQRICRPMWWTGNPLVPDATFDAGSFDADFEMKTYSLTQAMDEGIISFAGF